MFYGALGRYIVSGIGTCLRQNLISCRHLIRESLEKKKAVGGAHSSLLDGLPPPPPPLGDIAKKEEGGKRRRKRERKQGEKRTETVRFIMPKKKQ